MRHRSDIACVTSPLQFSNLLLIYLFKSIQPIRKTSKTWANKGSLDLQQEKYSHHCLRVLSSVLCFDVLQPKERVVPVDVLLSIKKQFFWFVNEIFIRN